MSKKIMTRKRWMSLSATAMAGAAAGSSLAGIVVTSVNQTFNFGDADLVLDLPGINDMRVFSTTQTFSRSVGLGAATGATYFQVQRFAAGTFSGRTRQMALGADKSSGSWNTLGGNVGSSGLLGATDTTFGPIGTGPYADRFFAFRFKDSTAGGAVRYGWLEASLLAVGSPDTVTVDLKSYAYDDTGATIHLGATVVPEPTSSALMGMGALVLGSVGVRRWRQSKQQQPAA